MSSCLARWAPDDTWSLDVFGQVQLFLDDHRNRVQEMHAMSPSVLASKWSFLQSMLKAIDGLRIRQGTNDDVDDHSDFDDGDDSDSYSGVWLFFQLLRADAPYPF